ncbi:MAG: hypothetical protein AAB365_03280 [Patescibacteria group bacterium]
MLKISEFFKRIQGKHSKELAVRSTVAEAIKKHARFDIPLEYIDFSSSTAILKGITAMQRSQIFIKKQTILSEINSQQSIRVVTDIR